jgi:hypothetical protein
MLRFFIALLFWFSFFLAGASSHLTAQRDSAEIPFERPDPVVVRSALLRVSSVTYEFSEAGCEKDEEIASRPQPTGSTVTVGSNPGSPAALKPTFQALKSEDFGRILLNRTLPWQRFAG